MIYYFLRFAGTRTYLGKSKSGERVMDEQPIAAKEKLPRPFDTIEEAEATGRYYQRMNPEADFEIVSQDYKWTEPEDMPATEPEPVPDEPEPKPEPEPEPVPAGTLWLLDGQTGERVAAIEDGATMPKPPSGTFSVEADVATTGKVRLEGAGQSRSEGAAPFVLHGDKDGVPMSSSPAEGEHEVTVWYDDATLSCRFSF